MPNSTTTSTAKSAKGFARVDRKPSDVAPMVINRLSGWIDVGEVKSELKGWIIPTRVQVTAR